MILLIFFYLILFYLNKIILKYKKINLTIKILLIIVNYYYYVFRVTPAFAGTFTAQGKHHCVIGACTPACFHLVSVHLIAITLCFLVRHIIIIWSFQVVCFWEPIRHRFKHNLYVVSIFF
jgi:hypothetical protein